MDCKVYMVDLFKEEIDPRTGRSSLQNHTVRVVQTWCKPSDHYFDQSEDVRLATCTKCGYSVPFVIGLHQIKDGKLTKK